MCSLVQELHRISLQTKQFRSPLSPVLMLVSWERKLTRWVASHNQTKLWTWPHRESQTTGLSWKYFQVLSNATTAATHHLRVLRKRAFKINLQSTWLKFTKLFFVITGITTTSVKNRSMPGTLTYQIRLYFFHIGIWASNHLFLIILCTVYVIIDRLITKAIKSQ